MGKVKQSYMDYLALHPEIDPEDNQHSLREAHIMRNRYTDQVQNGNTKQQTATEIKQDLTLLAFSVVLILLIIFS